MASVFKTPEGERQVLRRYETILSAWPVAARQHRLPTRYGETFVVESGPQAGRSLVVLHGTAANAASWIVDLPAWSHDFRVFCIDIIGDAGLSAQVRPACASEAYAAWLDDVLAGLGVGTAMVVGMSFGGFVALDYATRRPERVDKLVLISPGGVGRSRNILLWALPLLLLGPWGRRKMLERIGGPVTEPLSPEARAIVEMSNLIFTHFKPRTEPLPQASDDALRRLTMPVLAILGGKDVFIDATETKRRLEGAVAHLTMQYLPEGHHFMPGQTKTVLPFLRDDDPGADHKADHQRRR